MNFEGSVMPKLSISMALSAVCLLTSSVRADHPSALDPATTDVHKIMQAALRTSSPEQSLSRMKMTTRDQSGTRERVMTIRSKRFEQGRKSLILVESPADVRNTGFLSIDRSRKSSGDEQWLYLPKLRRTTRVSSTGKADSFLGSDFSYSDMSEQDPDDFDWKILEQSTKVGDEDCWLVEGTPHTEAIQQEAGYVKNQIWVSKSKLLPIQIKAWTTKEDTIKYFKASEIRNVDGFWTAHKLQMRTLKGKEAASETLLEILSIAIHDAPVHDTDFNQERLERGL
jgi:hypothetical protein